MTVTDRPPRPALGRNFAALWTATVVSSLGDGLEVAALPLLATQMTSDPRLVAGLATAATLPWLVFGPIGGALVDRHDRRKLMVGVNVVRCALVAIIAAMVATHTATLPALYGVVFLLGVGETMFNGAGQAMLPALVERDHLEIANSRREIGELIPESFVGPPLGGLLFAAVAVLPFIVDSASFGLAAVLIWTIAGFGSPRAEGPPVPAGAKANLAAEVREGFVWLRHHRLLRSLCVVLGLANFAAYMTEGILVLYARHNLHLPAHDYGFLLAGIALGAVGGSFVAPALARRVGASRAILATLAVFAIVDVAVGTLSNAVLVTAVLALSGAVSTLWNVVTISLRQIVIPGRLFGRVNSAYRLVGFGAMPIGALAGGFVSHSYGLRAPFYVAAAITVIALILAKTVITQPLIDEAKASIEGGVPAGDGR